MYTELKSKIVKVKKPHECAWCAEQIDAKNLAEYRVYIYEGDFNHDWMHLECVEQMRQLDIDCEFTWMPGEFARGKCHA